MRRPASSAGASLLRRASSVLRRGDFAIHITLRLSLHSRAMLALTLVVAAALSQQPNPPPESGNPAPPPSLDEQPTPGAVPPSASSSVSGDLASELKNKLLFVKVERGTNFSLTQNGHSMELGLFGGDALEVFSSVPEAKEEADGFHTKRIVGFSLG